MVRELPPAAVAEAKSIERLLLHRQGRQALDAATEFVQRWPGSLGHVLEARAAQAAGAFARMRAAAEAACVHAPTDWTAHLLLAEALIAEGALAEARNALSGLEIKDAQTAAQFARLGELNVQLGDHESAERCHAAALALAPNDPVHLYNMANSALAAGRTAESERLLDTVIRLTPDDFDAYYNRSTLRRQTEAANHVRDLRDLTAAHPDAFALHFALAKELEDLGLYGEAFKALKHGAEARRRRLRYRVEDDIETMASLAEAFDKTWAHRAKAGPDGEAAVFVLGLPRTGSTLVDRILSSHSQVESLGEIQDLPLALMQAVGPARDKVDLMAKSAALDPAALGEAYLRRIRGYGPGAPRLIDKTPSNFLYIGLIAKAMPDAQIIHVRRAPADACYAIFKTLFRMGYPYSYDLGDIAGYYCAYRRLMDHWDTVFPGRILHIDYESLVRDQESVSRRMISQLGLDWEDACLAFHANPARSATASAGQIREPIHDRSIGLWRRYETELTPLTAALRAAGIAPEAAQ